MHQRRFKSLSISCLGGSWRLLACPGWAGPAPGPAVTAGAIVSCFISREAWKLLIAGVSWRLQEAPGALRGGLWTPWGWILAPPGLPFRSFQRFLRSASCGAFRGASASAGWVGGTREALTIRKPEQTTIIIRTISQQHVVFVRVCSFCSP